MPWSPWIQSDPYERGTFARYRMITQSGTGVDGGASAYEVITESATMLYATTDATSTVYGQNAGGSSLLATRAENATNSFGTWNGGVIQNQAVAWFDTGDLELATWREWSPPEFTGLTEGVDYGVRPDRTGTEDDAFIQYEDGVGQIQNWSATSSARITMHNASYDPRHATAKWRLLLPPPTVPAIPPTSGSVDAPPLVLTPDDGSPVATVDFTGTTVTGTGGSTTPVEVVVDGPVSGFAVLMVTDESPDVPSAEPTDTGYVHEWRVAGLPGIASAYVLLPRWRYWIPRELPLQQKQRNDGLGLRGAPAWRQRRSRQATNSWRANL